MASAIACVAGSTAQDTQISNLAHNMGCSKPVILRILFFRFSRRVFDKGIGRRLDYRTQYSKDLFGTRVNCRFFTTCDSVGLQLFATAEEGNKDTI